MEVQQTCGRERSKRSLSFLFKLGISLRDTPGGFKMKPSLSDIKTTSTTPGRGTPACSTMQKKRKSTEPQQEKHEKERTTLQPTSALPTLSIRLHVIKLHRHDLSRRSRQPPFRKYSAAPTKQPTHTKSTNQYWYHTKGYTIRKDTQQKRRTKQRSGKGHADPLARVRRPLGCDQHSLPSRCIQRHETTLV